MLDSSINVHQILENLQSEDSDAIRSGAFAAGDAGLEEAIPFLCKHLTSENLGIQEAAEYALRKIRGPRTVDAVLPLLCTDDAPIRNVAMDILREIGVDNMRTLRDWLHNEDPDVRIFVSDILGYTKDHLSVPLLGEVLLHDPEVNVRYQAAISLGNLGYPEAVDYLAKAMEDEEWVQFAVVEALSRINDESTIRALVQVLPQVSPLVCSAIIDAIGSVGDIKTIPLLFKSLENVSVALRHKTVKAIVQILGGQSLSLLTPKLQERLRIYLLDALTDNDEDILMAALQGLSFMGDVEASRAVFDLACRIDPDQSPELYEYAIRAIASIGYNDVIRDALTSGDDLQIMIAMEACQIMGDHRPVEVIKSIFWSLSSELQRAGMAELSQLGTPEDIPFFKEVISRCSDAEILKSALIFFGNQHGCEDACTVAFSQLDHRYVDVKEMALEACINLHSPILNQRFRERMGSDDDMQRLMAVYAMGRYGVTENLSEISDALEDQSPRVRQMAVEAFLNLGIEAERYLPRIIPRLFDENKDVRAAVVNLLGQIGTPSVMPHLMTALNDDNDWVRIRAVEALGLNKAIDAVPTLASMLEHSSPMLTFKIIEVLGKIGGNVAFSVLLSMMDHEDPEIQHAAAEAVAAIQAEQE
ncbi:HEAT repeat domain-containing protein [uncultured Desulfovibrio sp.]|uniref:HEAT repeat domain-containing protein n=1 Tax=Candidatus Desulfovibrio intestinavium TaxID=2838534 RepID=A0A9D2KQP0_9BACT|nr:HEAT repeat domain-containing protein [uncultured Desulfovibrio sp.]HJA79183.1 HEAT repeat domain-containing protein [Candidatus Desulfovibrio intestinavium]